MKSRQRHAGAGSRPEPMDRRTFFSRVGDGLQGAALATLLGTDLLGPDSLLAAGSRQVYDLKKQDPHFEPRATSVIQLFMNGGPSQVDLLDPKPALEKFAGQPPSRDLASEIRAVREAGGLMPSPFKFAKHGESGIEVSEVMPHLAEQVDDITVIRSMFTPHIAHESSLFTMHSGRMFPGRPSLGAWVVYGLGTENRNLPAYVVLDDPKGLPINDIQNWQAGLFAGRLPGDPGTVPGIAATEPASQGGVAQSGGEAVPFAAQAPGSRPLEPAPGRSRSWKPALPATSWRPACNWPLRMLWMCRGNPRPPRRCTASTTSRPLLTASAA